MHPIRALGVQRILDRCPIRREKACTRLQPCPATCQAGRARSHRLRASKGHAHSASRHHAGPCRHCDGHLSYTVSSTGSRRPSRAARGATSANSVDIVNGTRHLGRFGWLKQRRAERELVPRPWESESRTNTLGQVSLGRRCRRRVPLQSCALWRGPDRDPFVLFALVGRGFEQVSRSLGEATAAVLLSIQ